jgi:hypothetical protein
VGTAGKFPANRKVFIVIPVCVLGKGIPQILIPRQILNFIVHQIQVEKFTVSSHCIRISKNLYGWILIH